MVKKTNIAFDIDNVVLDFAECFLKTAKEKFKLLKNVELFNITRYQFYECLDISYKECFEVVDYVLDNPFECKIKAVPGAVESLTRLSRSMGLIFVTARKEKFKKTTKESLYSILPNVSKDKIIIKHCKGSEKYIILNKLGIDFFIDDRSRNVRILNKKGIKTFLINKPWNAKTRPGDSFTRIDTWKEISNLTKEIHSGKAI